MSTVASLANCIVTVWRRTAFLLDPIAVAASHALTRQPVGPGPLQVEVTGSPSGTVTVSGTVGGVADTEVLPFSGVAGVRVTVKSFSAYSGITTSLTGATLISAQSVGAGGAPQNVLYAVVTGLPAERRHRGEQSWPGMLPGNERKEGATFRIQYEETWAPRPGDLVKLDGSSEAYEVKAAPVADGNFGPDHWRLSTDLRQGTV